MRQGVKLQRHLNEGAAGQATYHKTQCPKWSERARARSNLIPWHTHRHTNALRRPFVKVQKKHRWSNGALFKVFERVGVRGRGNLLQQVSPSPIPLPFQKLRVVINKIYLDLRLLLLNIVILVIFFLLLATSARRNLPRLFEYRLTKTLPSQKLRGGERQKKHNRHYFILFFPYW